MKTLLNVCSVVVLVVAVGAAITGCRDEEEAKTLQPIGGEVWTCAMHPQIRLAKAGKCPLCGMDLVTVKNEKKEDVPEHAPEMHKEEGETTGEHEGASGMGAHKPTLAAQTVCPIMRGKINKAVYADHDGKRVYFCCPGCIAAFKKSPEKHISNMKEQGITLADVPG